MRIVSFAVLSAAGFLLTACATPLPAHEALPPAAHDQIASTEAVVPIRQNEIYVYVPPSTAGATAGAGFGLIGALVGVAIDASVDSARTSKAEAAVKPLRDAMVDFNFDTTFQGDLKTALPAIAWLHADNIHVVKEVTSDSADLALTNSKASAVLFTTADYHLSNDGDELFVTLQASLFANNDALRVLKPAKSRGPRVALENSLYHNTLTFKARVSSWTPVSSSDRDANMATWSAANGAEMHQQLARAAKVLAQMLADDLQGGAQPGSDGTRNVDGIPGDISSSDDAGSVLRMKDGTLVYATKSLL